MEGRALARLREVQQQQHREQLLGRQGAHESEEVAAINVASMANSRRAALLAAERVKLARARTLQGEKDLLPISQTMPLSRAQPSRLRELEERRPSPARLAKEFESLRETPARLARELETQREMPVRLAREMDVTLRERTAN
jgi:hypothetical protein